MTQPQMLAFGILGGMMLLFIWGRCVTIWSPPGAISLPPWGAVPLILWTWPIH